MKRTLGLCFAVAMLSGCAGTKKIDYTITSDPPNAQVDVNGVRMGETPVGVWLSCSRRWVGVMNAPGGWAHTSGTYEVTAYPPRGYRGYSQTKRIDPCQSIKQKKATLNFDLNLEAVAPRQKYEIINRNVGTSENGGRSHNDTINSLKYLREQGLITEEEYKEKVLRTFE